jgi:curved DNA-binding protein CbpA
LGSCAPAQDPLIGHLKVKMNADQSNCDTMGEALKAKDAAERKFHARNFKGARRSAIKAHNLCPSLEGISQMVATLEVHLASESKIDGESDWYRILSLSSSADEEEVKKQYKSLALLLHPDKNKSVGGETAFKLVSEAWSVLSDKSRKMVYDQKVRDHSIVNGANGLYTYDKKANKRARKNSAAASAAAESTIRPPGVDTFWTSCNHCRMQYEYLRIYLNHNLLCPNCQNAFMAVETGYPSNGSSSFSWSTKPPPQKKHSTIDHSYNSTSRTSSIPGTGHGVYQQENTYEAYNNQTFQFNQYTKTTDASAYNTHTLEKAKRKNEENHIYSYFPNANEYQSGRGRHSNRRRNNSNGYAYVGCTGETLPATAATTVTADAERVSGINADVTFGERYRSAVSGRKANVLREIFQLDTRGLLIEKAKAAICEKLQDSSISTSTHFAVKGEAERQEKCAENNLKVNGILSYNPMKKCKISNTKDAGVGIPATDENNLEQKRVPVHIDVPDPDFHDFDKDRMERAFSNDQVWATYDSEDGMPRLYAMVQKVISLKPFRIKMSFLNSKSNSELAPISWIASGFTKTCGDFRVGRYQITETVNIFSHRVNWTKGPRGIIRITPKKGDTWALYRNWSPDWNELTPDDVIYKYEIVEVIDDFTEEQGVNVIPLLKVAGFKAVFHRFTGPDVVRRIPKEELFRFSHRVPSRLLTGEERNNAPKGCHELDPAATPVDLLKVITDVKEDPVLGVSMQNSTSLASGLATAS